MLSLTWRFSSSVSQSAALTKGNGDGKHGRFRRPQVCQELVPAALGGRGGIQASQNPAAPWLDCISVSIFRLQSGWIVRAPG